MTKNKAQVAAKVKSVNTNIQNKGKNMKNNTKRVNQKDAKAVVNNVIKQVGIKETSWHDVSYANVVFTKSHIPQTENKQKGNIDIVIPNNMVESYLAFRSLFAPEKGTLLSNRTAVAMIVQLVKDREKIETPIPTREERKYSDSIFKRAGGNKTKIDTVRFSDKPYAICLKNLKKYHGQTKCETLGTYINLCIETYFKTMYPKDNNNIIGDDIKEEAYAAFRRITGLYIEDVRVGRLTEKYKSSTTLVCEPVQPIAIDPRTKKEVAKLHKKLDSKAARANKGYSVNSIIRNAMSQVIAAKV